MDELILAAFLDELAEIEKQAQIFQRIGRMIARTPTGGAIERGVRAVPGAVQRGAGAVQRGIHHGVVKSHTLAHMPEALVAGAMKGGSPGAAILHAAPAIMHDVSPLVRRAGQVMKKKVRLARRAVQAPQYQAAMA
jgi:hypothetical protein